MPLRVQKVEASGTIYIRADGSIDPPGAPISTVYNVTYTFTDNIFDEIVVERDNIVVDGAGYTVEGSGIRTGISLTGRSNVTIKNVEIKAFDYGIQLYYSSHTSISGTNITANNYGGVVIHNSSYNKIIGNNIAYHVREYSHAVRLGGSNNIISGNNITNNFAGILLENYEQVLVPYGYEYVVVCYNNLISENNITNNDWGIGGGDGYGVYSYNNTYSKNTIANNTSVGIDLYHAENNTLWGNIIANNGKADVKLTMGKRVSNNIFYHNNFINNTPQVEVYVDVNIWDDGYPSGGNYWSDYNGVDVNHDGIGDTPYIIDANNADHYPLMSPYVIPELPSFFILPLFMMATLLAFIVYRRKHPQNE
jgi:parallel beta-helix repeat protein